MLTTIRHSTTSHPRRLHTTVAMAIGPLLAAALVAGATALPVEAPVTVYSSFEDGRDIAMADWDGDGDLDLLGASFGGEGVNGWLNQGDFWSPLDWSHGPGPANDLAVGDIDGNGQPDLLYVFGDAAGTHNKVGVILNRLPDLLVTVESSGLGNPQCVDLGDLDGDGDLDAITCEFSDNEISWHENVLGNGEGWATQQVIAGAGNPADAVLHDVDLDGDLDIVVAGFNKLLWVENRLSEPTPGWTAHDIDTDVSALSSVRMGDVTGDGVEEIVAGAVNVALLAYWSRGADPAGPWTRTTLQSNKAVADVGLADLDQDGDLDILASLWNASEGGLRYWDNDALGGFSEHNLGGVYDKVRATAIGDLDGDGDPDFALVTGTSSSVATIENRTIRGKTFFTTVSMSGDTTGGPSPIDLETADLDRDGDSDLVSFDTDSRLRLRDNPGDAGTTLAVLTSSLVSQEVFQLGDVDGDGDLDAVMGLGDGLEWLENPGDGNPFTRHTIDASAYMVELELADLDHNGQLDVVGFDGGAGEVRLWANLDHGDDWGATTVAGPITSFQEIAVVDIDRDGTAEIVVAADDEVDAYPSPSNLAGSPVLISTGTHPAVASGDFDGDGDTDLVGYNPADQELAFWINTGGLTFSRRLVDFAHPVAELQALDVDLDGDLDLVATHGDGCYFIYNKAIPSDPVPSEALGILFYRAHRADLVDYDRDGFADLVGVDATVGDFTVAHNDHAQYDMGAPVEAPREVEEGSTVTVASLRAHHYGAAGDLPVHLVALRLAVTADGTPLSGAEMDQLFRRVWVERVDPPGVMGELIDPTQPSPLHVPLDQGAGLEVLISPPPSGASPSAALHLMIELEPDAADTFSSFEITLGGDSDDAPATDSMSTPLHRRPVDDRAWSFTVIPAGDGPIFEDDFESGGLSQWSATVP